MAYLLFCNNCVEQSTGEKPNLFLSCGHIFCKRCIKLNESGHGKCLMCNNMASATELSKIPENLKRTFFTTDYNKVFEQSLKVLKFQLSKEQNSFRKIVDYKQKYKKIKARLEKETQEAKDVHQKLQKLRAKRQMMQAKLIEIYEREQAQKKKLKSQQYRDHYSLETPSSPESSVPSVDKSATPLTFTPNKSFFQTPFGSSGGSFFECNMDVGMRSSPAPSSSSTTPSSRSPFFA